MRRSKTYKPAISMLLLVAAIVAGIILANASAPGTAQERQGFRVAAPAETPFNGILLGIRFGPTDALVKEGVQMSLEQRCPTGRLDIRDGAEFLPPPPGYLPNGAIQSIPPGYLDMADAPNPFALVCRSTGEVLRAALSYAIPVDNGPAGELHILRVFGSPRYFPTTASAEQIQTVRVGPREGVLIDTSTPAGLWLPGVSAIALVFPEPDGYLAVTSFGIPAEDTLKLAGSLAVEGLLRARQPHG